jgi:hypothetical protein
MNLQKEKKRKEKNGVSIHLPTDGSSDRPRGANPTQ